MPDLIETIKKAAQQANDAAKPVAVMFGIIQEEDPLKINVEQKMLLEKEQLILSRNVTEFERDVTPLNWSTGTASNHSHPISGRKKEKVHHNLKKGEKVVLLRVSGGQQYLVLDRVVSL